MVARRRKVLPVVAAVVQPVTKRLSRIEDLLTEIRHEQDVKHKKIAALQAQLGTHRKRHPAVSARLVALCGLCVASVHVRRRQDRR